MGDPALGPHGPCRVETQDEGDLEGFVLVCFGFPNIVKVPAWRYVRNAKVRFLYHEPVMGRVRTACFLVMGNPDGSRQVGGLSLMVGDERKFMQVRFS